MGRRSLRSNPRASGSRDGYPCPIVSGRVHLERLPDGPTLLLRESHAAPVAELQVLARVGSADEAPDESGLAHFHEHMLFKGTDTRDVEAVAGAIEGAGGRINAWTSFDTTCYHATLPSDAIGPGLEVLADVTQNAVFDAEEVRREIEVVLEEIRRSEDDPHHVLSDLIFATAFERHPYRRPILGTARSVASLDRERLVSFYRRWYAPQNLVVVAVGDFEVQTLRDRIAAAFEPDPERAPRRRRPDEPPQEGLRVQLLQRPFERACLDLSWHAVGLGHPDTPLLDLLAFVLGGGESSRLVRRIKEEAALCDRIEASCYTPLDPGLFSVTVDLETERAEQALAAVLRETERVRHEPVTASELERARANFLASQEWEREIVAGMARKLGSFQVLAGDHRHGEVYRQAIRAATAEDLRRVAGRYLSPEQLSVAGVLPDETAGMLDEAAVRGAVSAGAERARRAAALPRRLPPVHARSTEIQSYEMENGTRVVVAPRPEVPVVAVRAALLGGQLAEDESSCGLSSFLAGMWLRGTAGRSAADFAREMENLAGDVDAFSGRNSCGLTLDATRDRFLPVLDLLAEALLAPALAEDEIERERRETLALLARREDRLSARVFDLFARAQFPTHPYGLPLPGTPETVTRFDAERLHAHQARLVGGRNLVVAVAGDVDPDTAAEDLSRRLGDLAEGHALDAALPPMDPPPREAREVEERKDRAQAHLVVGFRGLTVHDPDRFALEVISQCLAGQGGRLFLELRDRRSLAYTVTALNVEGVAPGTFAVYIATAPEKLEEARAGILTELRRLREQRVPERELERARRYLIGSHAIGAQRSASQAMQLALDGRYGLGPEAHQAYPERIAAVTADDLQRVAAQVIDLEAPTLATIRP